MKAFLVEAFKGRDVAIVMLALSDADLVAVKTNPLILDLATLIKNFNISSLSPARTIEIHLVNTNSPDAYFSSYVSSIK